MKIVQVVPELSEGGVERGTLDSSREYTKRGLESIVISSGGKLSQQIECDGGRYIAFDVASKNILTAPWRIVRLKELLKQLQPDIIHVRSRVPAWLVYFANRSLGFKVVSTVHGFNSVNAYSKVMTYADKIICVSQSIKEYIQTNYHIQEEKMSVIPRGVDLQVFNPNNIDQAFIDNFLKKYHLEGRFIVTTVGRITQLKDFETFIQAITLLKKSYPKIIGLIVGGMRSDKEHYFRKLQELIKELEVTDNIIFTGSQNSIAEIYALSDVVVSASKKPESFGRSVAEAIAMNTPVVASNHGGVKDIIQEEINGYFFSLGDPEDLAKKITFAKKLNFDGYNYVKENFSLQQMIEKTIKVYKAVS